MRRKLGSLGSITFFPMLGEEGIGHFQLDYFPTFWVNSLTCPTSFSLFRLRHLIHPNYFSDGLGIPFRAYSRGLRPIGQCCIATLLWKKGNQCLKSFFLLHCTKAAAEVSQQKRHGYFNAFWLSSERGGHSNHFGNTSPNSIHKLFSQQLEEFFRAIKNTSISNNF